MSLDYNQLKDDLATAIATAMVATVEDSFSSIPVSGFGLTATWDGTSTVLVPDTSTLAVGNFVQSIADGKWYKIASITPNTSIQVTDTFSVGGFPSGGSPSAIAQTLTWDGTPTVTTADTSGLSVGDHIRLDSDGGWFTIGDVVTDTSLLVLNPLGLTIPSGSTQSSKAGSVFMQVTLPDPPDTGKLKEKFGEPIAYPVIDDLIVYLSNQPREFANVTVSGLSGLSPGLGDMVFVTDAATGSIPAFYDGTNWRRVDTRAIVS